MSWHIQQMVTDDDEAHFNEGMRKLVRHKPSDKDDA